MIGKYYETMAHALKWTQTLAQMLVQTLAQMLVQTLAQMLVLHWTLCQPLDNCPIKLPGTVHQLINEDIGFLWVTALVNPNEHYLQRNAAQDQ